MPTAQALINSLPLRFLREKAGGYQGCVHFTLSGEGGGSFTASIEAGTCQVTTGHQGSPTCQVKAKAEHYVALETGALNPQLALLTGKVKVQPVGEMLAFSRCFRRWQPAVGEAERPAPPPRKPPQGPLTGLRILDFTRLLPGPLATMQLAELGAEVWKVEHPDRPDYVREAPPLQDGISAYYRALNRSKRSLALAYDQPEGLEALRARIREADLVVEQFRPGVMDALGLGVEDIWAVNPRCGYVSLTGFGQQGPRRDQAGHDLNYLALSGILSLNRDERGRPVIPGFQLADIAGGSYLVVSACTLALLAAQRTGQGEYVDVGMAGGLLPLLTLPWAAYQATGEQSANGHTPLSGAWVNYQVYQAADDRWVALGALEPKFWARFCEAVDRPDWKAWLGEAPAAHPEVADLFASRSRDEWAVLGARVDCCLSPVLALDELATEPQWADAWAGEGPDRGFATPLSLRRQPGGMQGPAPELGADWRGERGEMRGKR